MRLLYRQTCMMLLAKARLQRYHQNCSLLSTMKSTSTISPKVRCARFLQTPRQKYSIQWGICCSTRASVLIFLRQLRPATSLLSRYCERTCGSPSRRSKASLRLTRNAYLAWILPRELPTCPLGANGGHTMVCPRLPLEHCRGQGLSRAQPRTVCPHRSLRAQLRTGSVRACRLGHSCGQASRLEYSRGQGLSAPVAERTAADRVCPHLSLMQHSCGQGLSAHVPWSTAASVRAGR